MKSICSIFILLMCVFSACTDMMQKTIYDKQEEIDAVFDGKATWDASQWDEAVWDE